MMQPSFVIVLLSCALMLELMEFSETYKPVKPYKFYNPYPRRPPRWQPFTKPKRYAPKRIPSQKHQIYEPDYERYSPVYEDSANDPEDDQPYVIIIFPRKKEKNRHYYSYQRQHVADPPRNIDYIDDNDDDNDKELRVYRVDNETVRIKVNDRLSLLTRGSSSD